MTSPTRQKNETTAADPAPACCSISLFIIVMTSHYFISVKLCSLSLLQHRETYTVVTIIDQPFNTRQIPVYVDGVPYCQTPSIVCLDIDNQIIIDNHHHPDTVRQVFYGRCQPGTVRIQSVFNYRSRSV